MTPQQKAKELFHKYYLAIPSDEMGLSDEASRQCALIAVDELLEATKRYDYTLGPNPSYNEYWLKVKYQLEQL